LKGFHRNKRMILILFIDLDVIHYNKVIKAYFL
jgi:hypothetical protein